MQSWTRRKVVKQGPKRARLQHHLVRESLRLLAEHCLILDWPLLDLYPWAKKNSTSGEEGKGPKRPSKGQTRARKGPKVLRE